jgi:hypothetical protein
MTDFQVRVCGGLLGAAIITPIAGGMGALIGYVYAKLADLPATQAAQAWAVWFVVESIFITLAEAFTENQPAQALIKSAVFTAISLIGLHELQKRGAIGNNMVIFVAVLTTYAIQSFLRNVNPTMLT